MEHKTPGPPHRWQPGESGNPKGRTRRKPITSVILAALNKPMYANDRRTMAECFRDRLAQIILSGEDGHSIAAFKMLLEYTEGKPQQSVTIDFDRAVDEISNRTGAPKLWLMRRASEISLRHALEGGNDGDTDDTGGYEGGGYSGIPRGRISGIRIDRNQRSTG